MEKYIFQYGLYFLQKLRKLSQCPSGLSSTEPNTFRGRGRRIFTRKPCLLKNKVEQAQYTFLEYTFLEIRTVLELPFIRFYLFGFLAELARPITPASAFIGLRDNTLGQYVTWSDASAVAFASWDAGQPDHYQGRQHCVRLQTDRNGAWDDVECDNGAIRAGICQMSSAVTTG